MIDNNDTTLDNEFYPSDGVKNLPETKTQFILCKLYKYYYKHYFIQNSMLIYGNILI